MKKIKNFIVNLLVILTSTAIASALILVPFCAVAFSVDNNYVIWLESRKHNIEMRLESESSVDRIIAEMDAKRYNTAIATYQKDNKKIFIGSFISDAVDALELIEL